MELTESKAERCSVFSYSVFLCAYGVARRELQCKLRSLAILTLGLARLCLEKADEVLRIFKAEALAYLRYAEGFIIKQLAGSRKQSVVDHTLGCPACLSLDQFAEIFGRIAAFVGKIGYGRHPFSGTYYHYRRFIPFCHTGV